MQYTQFHSRIKPIQKKEAITITNTKKSGFSRSSIDFALSFHYELGVPDSICFVRAAYVSVDFKTATYEFQNFQFPFLLS